MLHLRAIVPNERTDQVCAMLEDNLGATNLVVLPGAARSPLGDVVMCDIAREAANEVIEELQNLGIHVDGSIALEQVDVSISEAADAAEQDAPGHGDDAVISAELNRRTLEDARMTWAFLVFLALATQLAGIASIIDSPILIVGSMVLGPEFGAVAAISFGIVFKSLRHIRTALCSLTVGFLLAIAVTFVCALVSRWLGVIEVDKLPSERPFTGFVYQPDRWSFIVALLAGAAGVLSITAGKSSALVGVFISVTTVPAAGNLAVALALTHVSEIRGSLEQLVVNIAGMTVAGTATLIIQKAGWALVRKNGRRCATPTTHG